MSGKLYGIGAGPGDPELLTIKAINAIMKCGVVAVPETGNGETTALSIIKKHIDGKDILKCRFAMEHDMAKRIESRKKAAGDIMRVLDSGTDVAFITLGDPTTYSTYMYVHETIANRGYDTQIIPGISSYSAAAAALGIPLCEGGETLMIAAGHDESLDRLLDSPGNKVIMKSGASFMLVLEKLKERGYGSMTKIACRVTMEGQRLFASIDEYEKSPEGGYFTIAIVKGARESGF